MKYFVVDAFTSELFKGNPAGVCISEKRLDAEKMQKIAAENNLSETAFLYKCDNNYYELRWFTPLVEIDLCGHATLASAFVIMNYIDESCAMLQFKTASGVLNVEKRGDRYFMDFPSRKAAACQMPEQLEKALGIKAIETYLSRDLLVLVEDEKTVIDLNPDIELLKTIEGSAVIVTAKGQKYDFVSRFFAPKMGVAEDPVTGSAHCTLIPFWSERLGKNEMTAFQHSKRGGEIICSDKGERVLIGGNAILYYKAEIDI